MLVVRREPLKIAIEIKIRRKKSFHSSRREYVVRLRRPIIDHWWTFYADQMSFRAREWVPRGIIYEERKFHRVRWCHICAYIEFPIFQTHDFLNSSDGKSITQKLMSSLPLYLLKKRRLLSTSLNRALDDVSGAESAQQHDYFSCTSSENLLTSIRRSNLHEDSSRASPSLSLRVYASAFVTRRAAHLPRSSSLPIKKVCRQRGCKLRSWRDDKVESCTGSQSACIELQNDTRCIFVRVTAWWFYFIAEIIWGKRRTEVRFVACKIYKLVYS